jgi:cyclic pyranopterin phosphate synthase
MVNISSKHTTRRRARAVGQVLVPAHIGALLAANTLHKGDALRTAQLAGIMGAKHTHTLIPLCHPLPLTSIDVSVRVHDNHLRVLIEASVECDYRTGVEMEALTAVSIAALTVYDMCKSADTGRAMRIQDIHLVHKSGGASGDYESSNDHAGDE